MTVDLFENDLITRGSGESADAASSGMERAHAAQQGFPPLVGENPTPRQDGSRAIPADKADPAGAAVHLCGTCGESTPWILSGNGEHSGFVDCAQLQAEPGNAGRRFNARAACAFTPTRWKPIDAKRLAQRGIDQAVAAADRELAGWSDDAFLFVRTYAEQNRGGNFIGHDIVNASVAAGVAQPPNPKAWGGPIQRAARLKIIERIGYAEDPNRHGNPVPLWRTV